MNNTSDEFAAVLVKAMEIQGHPVDRNPTHLNIVYVGATNLDGTMNDNKVDEWNDLCGVIRFDTMGKPRFVFLGECTIDPGKYYVKNRINPAGAAQIEYGYYKAWQVGVHRGNHEALVQTGGTVKVRRDNNEDYKRLGDKVDAGYFGINQHGPSGHDEPVKSVDHYSAGCMVRQSMTVHRVFMGAVKTDQRYKDDKRYIFGTSILAPEWVQSAAKALEADSVVPTPVVPSEATPIVAHKPVVLISQDAIDLIVAEEVTSKLYYDKVLRHPEWPGGGSGVTIGIGYDVGAGVANKEELWQDWKGHIPDEMIKVLETCIGVTGDAASILLHKVKDRIEVPWEAAMAVFLNVDVPKWYAACKKYLPNFEDLHPDCKGALVSLAYNRGASFTGEGNRYIEMNNIRRYMEKRLFSLIPSEFRKMKRLWVNKGLDGLLRRRDREADLFARGLEATPVRKVEDKASTGLIAGTAGAATLVGTAWVGYDPVTTIAASVAVLIVILLFIIYWRGKGE